MAGWYWWDMLTERYNLSLRTPQNLSVCKVLTANSNMLNYIYDKVKNLLTKLDLKDNQLVFGTAMKLASFMSCNLIKQSAK
jgi:hypothetical protein